jgi:uncharacterized protein (DUF1800 family)
LPKARAASQQAHAQGPLRADTGQIMLASRALLRSRLRCSFRTLTPVGRGARITRAARLLAVFGLSATLLACGGGGGGSQAPNGSPLQSASAQVNFPASDNDAQRFLTQATFGPTDAAVAEVKALGYEPWIDAQIQMPQAQSHVGYFEQRAAAIAAANPGQAPGFNEVNHSFWGHALQAPDQLRQRVAFALSEIFVVSSMDGCGTNYPRGTASYMDMLADNAFGSYRNLLEKVAMHPIMGCYLSHLKNQRENALTGRVPDENFAREVMQLFSIGLHQLRPDGSVILDADGQPLETYTASDVAGLAQVFTGFSYDCPDWPADNCFYWGANNGVKLADPWSTAMVGYPQFHSYATAKRFLGVSIPAATRPNPDADLQTALDFLALTHPNVGPFIGKQLIQRLVTSNPSPAYVARVTAAFEASGRSMGAMVKAVLTDPEARDAQAARSSETFGKVREPVLRLSAFLRAMGTRSDSGQYIIDPTDSPTQLSQSPLRAPNVFNFFRPGYVYPGGRSASAGLVAPELQIANESSAAGYVNFMRDVISAGAGRYQTNAQNVARNDVRLAYSLDTSNDWYTLARATDAAPLLERINQKLMYGGMSDALRAEIKAAIDTLALSATPTEYQVRNRLNAALLLTVASPEFQVQK